MIQEKDFMYCPQCGNEFSKMEENLLVCRKCNLHYYVNPKACNAVVLENDKKEILFVKRKYEPQKGFWDLPGGFVDVNETLEASVHREMLEELTLDLETFHYIGSMADTYEFKGIHYHTVCALFLGKIPDNATITPSDDAEECVFFPISDIPFDKIAFEGIKAALKQYAKRV